MLQRIDKLLVGVCAVLALTVANAEVQDDFENTNAGETPTSWTGNGTVSATEYTYSKSVGHSITNANQTYKKVLDVAGRAVRTYQDTEKKAGQSIVLDIMVKMTAADEVPDNPEDATDIQFAVATGAATDSMVPLYYYNKESTEENKWEKTDKSYTEDSWVRITIVMDYESKTCSLMVDGEVVKTGITIPEKTDTNRVISTLTVEGSTSVDDLVVRANDSSSSAVEPFPETATSDTAKVGDDVPVKLNWLYKNGIDASTDKIMETSCQDGSGMTYAQKYEAGLDINDKQKFEVTSMSITDANTAAFTLPGKADSYEVVINSDGTETKVTPETSTTDGKTTATVNLSSVSGKVIKFTVKAKATKVQ